MPLDPVCKANLEEKEAKGTATFKGEVYHFCCPSCQEEFLHNPKKYVSDNWWKRFMQRLEKANEEEFGSKGPSCH